MAVKMEIEYLLRPKQDGDGNTMHWHIQGSCDRRRKQIQGFSRPFHSLIQGFFQSIIL